MQNYNGIQKFLHDFVLNKKFINKSLYELEKIIYLKNKDIRDKSHIFITGLPRSGTTSLLNFIYSSDQFASLTFRNMPFVLSPNISKIFNKKNISKKERLHGDGINYDMNSPEALDEIFFRNDNEFIETELINYIQLILLSKNKDRYLSKNNLNFKRINLIQSKFKNSIFLIPIREPIQHAYSLLNQHILFSKLQKKDDFIRRYMNYLGHNEFGIEHKPWNVPVNHNNSNNLDYWIEQWYLFYKNLISNYEFNNDCLFVIYEELTNPEYIEILLEKISLEKNENLNINYFRNSNNKKIDTHYNDNNYNNARNLYNDLKQKIVFSK